MQGGQLWEALKVTTYGSLGEPGRLLAEVVEAVPGPDGDHLWEVLANGDPGLGCVTGFRGARFGAWSAI